MALIIRKLEKSDDRQSFCCGVDALDRYFQFYAAQNQFRYNLITNYVALEQDDEEGKILGFSALNVAEIAKESLPDAKLSKKLPRYPLPVLRLARLGVDQKAQGQGVAHALLLHCFELSLMLKETLGCIGVTTDAKPGAVAYYERFGFETLEGVERGALLDAPCPMFLSMKLIEASLKASRT